MRLKPVWKQLQVWLDDYDNDSNDHDDDFDDIVTATVKMMMTTIMTTIDWQYEMCNEYAYISM